MVARWLRMETGHIKKNNHMMRTLRLCTMCYQSDLQGWGGGHQVQPHGQWFSQWCLYNEILIKSLETEAQASFLCWQYFTHILPHIATRGHRSFTCGALPVPDSTLCISSFGWFWFVSFGYSKTKIIKHSPVLNSVSHCSDLSKLMVVLENPQTCNWWLKSWAELAFWRTMSLALSLADSE